MRKFNMVLTILLIILLLIIVGEFIYTNYSGSIQKAQKPTSVVNKKLVNNKLTITLKKDTVFIPYNPGMTLEKDLQSLFETIPTQKIITVLHQLQLTPKKTVVSSLWITQYKGTIMQIGNGASQGKAPPVDLWFNLNEGQDKISAFYTDKDIGALKVYSMKGKIKTPMKYKDLKKGDIVELKETYDAQTDTLKEAEIIVDLP